MKSQKEKQKQFKKIEKLKKEIVELVHLRKHGVRNTIEINKKEKVLREYISKYVSDIFDVE